MKSPQYIYTRKAFILGSHAERNGASSRVRQNMAFPADPALKQRCRSCSQRHQRLESETIDPGMAGEHPKQAAGRDRNACFQGRLQLLLQGSTPHFESACGTNGRLFMFAEPACYVDSVYVDVPMADIFPREWLPVR